jgi:hypothetical protein
MRRSRARLSTIARSSSKERQYGSNWPGYTRFFLHVSPATKLAAAIPRSAESGYQVRCRTPRLPPFYSICCRRIFRQRFCVEPGQLSGGFPGRFSALAHVSLREPVVAAEVVVVEEDLMPSPAGKKEGSGAAGLVGTAAVSQDCLEVCFGPWQTPTETPLWRPPAVLARHLGRHSG